MTDKTFFDKIPFVLVQKCLANGYGGIAQLARAFGSYPKCHWFKSGYRYHIWLLGQVVKTPPSHGGYRGSNPLGVTIITR